MDSSHIFPHQETQEAFVSVAATSSTLSGQRLGLQGTRTKQGNARGLKVQHEVVSLFGAPPVLDI